MNIKRCFATKGLTLLSAMVLLSGYTSVNAESQTFKSGKNIASVVELYTSEGCSSCPPADEYLSRLEANLGEEAELIPLAFHVDYWNYLGWEDPFSKAEFTKRQRRLGALNNQRTIYTPEFIVDGKESRHRAIGENVLMSNESEAKADIQLQLDQSVTPRQAKITVDNIAKRSGSVLYVALYESDITRRIENGENRGRTLHHDYVVRDLQGPKRVKNGDTLSFNLPIKEDWVTDNMGVVVMVKSSHTGETLQALRAAL